MGGTKIVVLQLKEIIKKAVIAGGLIVVVALLVFLFMPKNKEGTSKIYKPGTYQSEIVLHNSPIMLTVTVTGSEIVSIQMEELDEVQSVFYPLFKPALASLQEEILENQSLDLGVSKDLEYTQEILIKAIRQALDKASV